MDTDVGRACATLRDAAVEWARQDLRADLSELHQCRDSLDAEIAKTEARNIYRKVQRLAPGRACTVTGIQERLGQLAEGH